MPALHSTRRPSGIRWCERHPDRPTRSPSALYCSLRCQHDAASERAMDRRTQRNAPQSLRTAGPTAETSAVEPRQNAPQRVLDGVTPCAYCGTAADTIDHTFPQSLNGSALDGFGSIAGLAMRHDHRKVPACRECNSLLGARIFQTFRERKACLKDLLRQRYRRYIEAPAWSDTEMARLGHTLRVHVAQAQAVRDLALQRIRW